MIVDTSALVAIVVREVGHEAILDKLTAPTVVAGIGTPTIAELSIVLSARLRIDARSRVVELLEALDIAEVPFGQAHWREAVDAFCRFGRGRHLASTEYSSERMARQILEIYQEVRPDTPRVARPLA